MSRPVPSMSRTVHVTTMAVIVLFRFMYVRLFVYVRVCLCVRLSACVYLCVCVCERFVCVV